MRRRRNGTALVTALLAGAFLFLLCFVLATLSFLNLNLSSNFSGGAQSVLMAQAAVAQFASEAQAFCRSVRSPYWAPDRRPDWVKRFKEQPVLPNAESRYSGRIGITFDRADPYFSVDNSDSAEPAVGWNGAGSVPPFTVDLIMTITVNGVTRHYEALLRRRWPYALCTSTTPGLFGMPPLDRSQPLALVDEMVEPSLVSGPVYRLADRFSLEADSSSGTALPSPREALVLVDPIMAIRVMRVVPEGSGGVLVGGPVRVQAGESRPAAHVDSTGNELLGRIDLMDDNEALPVVVSTGNSQKGRIQEKIDPEDLEEDLQEAFKLPETTSFKEIPGAMALADLNMAQAQPVGSSDFICVLKGNLRLPDARLTSSPPPTTPFAFPGDRRFIIRSSVGNHYLSVGGLRNQTGAGLELDNCLLYIDGDLDLSPKKPAGLGQPAVCPTLRGNNATLIVNGSLIMRGGTLESDVSGQGMVIYARRLVSMASGHYRGVVMVKESASFYPKEPPHPRAGGRASPVATASFERMEIDGGVICGSGTFVLGMILPPPPPPPPPTGPPGPPGPPPGGGSSGGPPPGGGSSGGPPPGGGSSGGPPPGGGSSGGPPPGGGSSGGPPPGGGSSGGPPPGGGPPPRSGGRPLHARATLAARGPAPGVPPRPPGGPPPPLIKILRTMSGVNLWSVTLQYSPRYLTTLHRYAPLTLTTLEQIP